MRFNNKNLFFKALFILKKKNNLIVTKIKKTKLSEIYKKNFTIVKVSYSTVNHKDKLVMNGNHMKSLNHLIQIEKKNNRVLQNIKYGQIINGILLKE